MDIPLLVYLSPNHEFLVIRDQVYFMGFYEWAFGLTDIVPLYGDEGDYLIYLANNFGEFLNLPEELLNHVAKQKAKRDVSTIYDNFWGFPTIADGVDDPTNARVAVYLQKIEPNIVKFVFERHGDLEMECAKAFRIIASCWINPVLQEFLEYSGESEKDHPLAIQKWRQELYKEAVGNYDEARGKERYSSLNSIWTVFTFMYLDYLRKSLDDGEVDVDQLVNEGSYDIVIVLLDQTELSEIVERYINGQSETQINPVELMFLSRLSYVIPSLFFDQSLQVKLDILRDKEKELTEKFECKSIIDPLLKRRRSYSYPTEPPTANEPAIVYCVYMAFTGGAYYHEDFITKIGNSALPFYLSDVIGKGLIELQDEKILTRKNYEKCLDFLTESGLDRKTVLLNLIRKSWHAWSQYNTVDEWLGKNPDLREVLSEIYQEMQNSALVEEKDGQLLFNENQYTQLQNEHLRTEFKILKQIGILGEELGRLLD